MAYPFPYYRVARSPYPQCPLPDKVDALDSYLGAKHAATECARAALFRYRETNDPRWTQYAQWFGRFAEQDRGVSVHYADGSSRYSYWGGAKSLIDAGSDYDRRVLWPPARDLFRDQVQRFHLGLAPLQSDDLQPTIECAGKDGCAFRCAPKPSGTGQPIVPTQPVAGAAQARSQGAPRRQSLAY